jgi:hypothetical protein
MGLDMFIFKRNGEDCEDYEEYEEVAYWRKANQIHHWFVTNVQDGYDDCDEYKIDRHDVEALLDIVTPLVEKAEKIIGKPLAEYDWWEEETNPFKSLAQVAEDNLPGCVGFFFGDNEYDSKYFFQLWDTKRQLEKVLEEWDDTAEYTYSSSW